MNPQIPAPRGSVRRALAGSSFGTRLFLALTVVVVGCAASAWLVASALAPGIFHDHLGQAGIDHNSSQAAHVEEAFAWAIVLAWGLAVGIAVLLALAVSWYITRRVQRSLTAVTTSTARIAGGRYDTRVTSPGLGREFDDLALTVNELARRLDATESTRRRMLADLGHEMRTPIATLDSYLEALDDGVRTFDDDTRQILRAATHRLGRLAQDITAVSRAEEHLTRIRPVPTTTGALVTAAVDAVHERYDSKGVALHSRVDDSVVVTVDPDRLGQVLGNLLDNALRHTACGGTVTVASRKAHTDRVEITVADTGEGIAADHLDHLFDRFYRADTARDRRHGGSGIGLTITRALVEAHHGRIRAHSDGPGRGARFTIELPVIAV
ncbi:sensor histidine kinase [Antrihabitans sp. NCIMB 15449]|jgi:two-component system, OmpR family, sensor histidine kinase BaeS|uniref:histidine kinase n=3 Tax=Nocardiaceae TaxID=85025 RepID=A0A1G8NPC4_9NOCA|nr:MULTISPECIES: ATP-binding protein [Rhodococcus]MDY6807521.1 ATP-binding protein [Actinomycetota bacterium]PZU04601.1 MAG: HAMP domain-containing protein [Gordonia sp. (in: high G+C Gram-positive bacteria)]QNG20052.1 HAMP domain-containing protein [Rhodococcus triatomae]QNG24032.1 HAMP domain-containing protein [Rhodococcus triatomae]UZF48432.1 HAMP domain-containing protein [Rhodococcus rhodochrous]